MSGTWGPSQAALIMKRALSPEQIIWLGLAVVALLILALRWERAGSRLLQAPQAASLLDTAMVAGAGETVTMAELAQLSASYAGTTGVTARALARLALFSGQPALAERWLRAGAAVDDRPNLTLFELCRFYWDRGDVDQALVACANSRSSTAYWLNLGYDAANAGRTTEAINLFAMAAATDPANAEAWHQLGRAYLVDKRYEDAIQAFSQQLALDANVTVDVYHALGEAQLQIGDATAARETLAAGARRFPDDKRVAVMLANALGESGDLAQAQQQFGRLAERYPEDADVWAGWGRAALAGGDAQAATRHLQEALRLAPDSVGYWLDLVEAGNAAGDIPVAAQAYRELMMLRPEDVTLWLNAGRFWLETGQLREARFVLDRVMQLEPDNEEADYLRQILLESTATVDDSAVQQP